MNLRKAFQKICIVFAMLILMLSCFSLIYGFIETASAPNDSGFPPLISEPGQSAPPDESSAADASDSPGSPETAASPPKTSDHVLIKMEPADISRGTLLLINHNHQYEIPDTKGFVSVADSKTTSYRAANGELMLAEPVIGPLNAMMDAFYAETGLNNVAVISAFRDYERQQEILSEYISLVGRAEAHRWAALPGHSEHHAGLAIDLGYYSGGALRTFLGTGDNAWFGLNAHLYGFILRFPSEKADITETAYEPWHFRYVGQPHAYFIFENDWCLEEYIEVLSESSINKPFIGIFDGTAYEVYYTSSLEISLPFDCEFDISGNNTDGFIVTISR